MDLLPFPRSLKRLPGFLQLPGQAVLHLDTALARDEVLLPLAERLRADAQPGGIELEVVTGPPQHPRLAVRAFQGPDAPNHSEGYTLNIGSKLVTLEYRDIGGLRAGVATLRQLLSQFGRRLPRLLIKDYPDFPRRGVMLDISRGRVPRLETLLELCEHLALFKINELQLYTEHTFAYSAYEPIWGAWGALTGAEILRLDARCRQLGIDLVPNQNSFGHLRYWLEYPPLKKLAEVSEPYEGADGTYLRYPTTLAPNNPGTLPFLRSLYDELLPHFSSEQFNVGCDETWDLGRGQSQRLCAARGKGRVYLDFLKQIHKEVKRRGRRMQFWGDIVLHHPELIAELPTNVIALNWGYESDHPFEREATQFAQAKVPFYVCPGTSSWMTLIGRHDNALANLRLAGKAGRRHGACGFLNTDWGDGGHPQPLTVSYIPYLAGAGLSWCAATFDEKLLVPTLSRDVFHDPTQRVAKAALALGLAHRKLNYFAPNITPLGAVIAAPLPRAREIPCRDGLKYYALLAERNIRAALEEVEAQRGALARGMPGGPGGEILRLELALAARMAEQSCHIMLWQQSLAAGHTSRARTMARKGIEQLQALDADFNAYWPRRNKATPKQCAAFLQWRIADYRQAKLQFPP
ncbi:MAG TPA: glycoside hydrolase family 20 zincin-like fold domain-containing protein [Verrucomicrobiae bacterium]|nr:glycoside hydrolase family 20 zincin-like fold domain-containing protein [Verrucomicrobiae bacterium]